MFKRIFTAALLFGAAATAPPALAQPHLPCAPRDTIAEALTEHRGEHLVAGGLRDAQRIFEIWASADTGSFTILLTFASGQSCVIGGGTHFSLFGFAPDLNDAAH